MGKAEAPTYISIIDGEIEFHDPSHIWGKLTGESQKLMSEKQRLVNS